MVMVIMPPTRCAPTGGRCWTSFVYHSAPIESFKTNPYASCDYPYDWFTRFGIYFERILGHALKNFEPSGVYSFLTRHSFICIDWHPFIPPLLS